MLALPSNYDAKTALPLFISYHGYYDDGWVRTRTHHARTHTHTHATPPRHNKSIRMFGTYVRRTVLGCTRLCRYAHVR